MRLVAAVVCLLAGSTVVYIASLRLTLAQANSASGLAYASSGDLLRPKIIVNGFSSALALT